MGGQVDGLLAGMMSTNGAPEGKKDKNHGFVRNVIQAAVFLFYPVLLGVSMELLLNTT